MAKERRTTDTKAAIGAKAPNETKRTATVRRRPPLRADGAEGGLDPAALAFGILPTLIARQLRIAQLRAFKDYAIEAQGADLRPGSFEILELLSHNPGLGQTRLAAAIGLEKSSLVPALAKLLDLGLVERRSSATDKRANELRITAKGSKALAALRRYVVARDAQITDGMSRAEIDTLNRLLTRIADINS